MKPIVTIVGRPNVGKSTLFNRLVRRRKAIVHDEPGVTRDRHYADTTIGGREVTLVDTGGFDPGSDDPMKQGIKRQIDAAMRDADVILCLLDSREPATSIDHAEMKLLREAALPTLFVANKADSERGELEAADLYRLGIDRLICVSALHGRRMGELEAAILEALPPKEATEEPQPEDAEAAEEATADRLLRVAIIGKPNAGKSSLTNRLAGEERMLVDDRPGTTRDSVDVEIERRGHRYLLVDTAGIRRKAKVTKEGDHVEGESVLSAIRAMERADVVVLLADCREGVAEQDAKILGLAVDRGRGIVVGLNKIDLLEQGEFKKTEEDAKDKLSFATYAEIVMLSAATGRGTDNLLAVVRKVGASFKKRITTGELNRFFEKVLKTHPPPTSRGRAPRLFFITQAAICPPTFVVSASDPEKIHFSYQRYVQNQIRKNFEFLGVPIVVHYRKRRRRGDEVETPKGKGKAGSPRKPVKRSTAEGGQPKSLSKAAPARLADPKAVRAKEAAAAAKPRTRATGKTGDPATSTRRSPAITKAGEAAPAKPRSPAPSKPRSPAPSKPRAPAAGRSKSAKSAAPRRGKPR